MRFQWTVVTSGAVLMLLALDAGEAAPCLGLFNSRHYHYHDLQTEAPKPEMEPVTPEDTRIKSTEQLFLEWLLSRTSTSSGTADPQESKMLMDGFIRYYNAFLSYLFG